VRSRVLARLVVFILLGAGADAALARTASAESGSIKVAFLNIQSGKGEPGLSGRVQQFADTANCTDPTQPLNGWGVGFVQQAIVSALRDDPSVIALGLAEAWTSVCGSPANVRALLGWAASTPSRNGVALVARYGFDGPEVWQQLDTSLNTNPADTMWVVRVPVCVDAACSSSIPVYAAHWYGVGSYKRQTYDKQAQQTVDFMKQTAGAGPHVLVGDLNAWEGSSKVCAQNPINAGVGKLRSAGYIDAWPRIHGSAEGFTGMTNRSGCGTPVGYTWKRIDYAWSSPGYDPLDITRFAMPGVPGDPAPSDHYGIIATYGRPGAPAVDELPPSVQLVSPAQDETTTGGLTFDVHATDNFGVDRVEIIEDGAVIHALTAAPYRLTCGMTRSEGQHTFQARAVDTSGNVAVSAMHTVTVSLPTFPESGPKPPASGTIVLHARRAPVVAGTWQIVEDATAAGGARVWQPDASVPKLTTAAAAPAHYFELTFTPAAGTPYRLWLRGRADRDAWTNDSVFVQFSGSVTSGGAPAFRIGTTAATVVSIEPASKAGVAGWGWEDNGYGTLGPLVYFDGQPQTIRIQAREDGISIDQIVLSPDTYLSAAPGAQKHDATILAETAAPAPAPVKEIVMRASTASTFAGTWRRIDDLTAADGVAVGELDARAAKVLTASSAPANYVELTFQADANRPYRLWMRARAERNAFTNDSAFVQFSGAVDPDGRPVYRIGTTDATVIVLEEDQGMGLAGWGWADNGWGAGVLGPEIRFETTGPQTLRIQTREDGLRFDQIVLSAEQYLTDAPGPTKNDTTILK
jgi:hypothetical protein